MPNPSLADLDKEPAQQQQQDLPKTDILPGTGDQTPEDLAAAKAKQDAEAAQQQQQADPTKAADDNAADDAADEPEGSIWEDVDALRGEKLEFEWKDEQGVIPEEEWDTPRGILARERALEGRAVERFETTLMEEDPRGYQYLLHRKSGGSDEDFFAQKTITLPDYDRFKESVDLQTKVYADTLRNAGVGEKQIKQLTDAAVKDKDIFELADAAYKKQQADEQKAIKDLNDQLARQTEQYNRNVQALNQTLTEQVASTDMKIVVPDAKRTEFLNFLRQHIRYDEESGGFLFAQPISQKALPRQLEAMYLQFSGGDLGGLVKREAQTMNTRRLRRDIDRSRTTPKDQADNSKKKATLGEL